MAVLEYVDVAPELAVGGWLNPRQGHGLLEASPAVFKAQTEGIGSEGGIPEVLNVGFDEPIEDIDNISRFLSQHDDQIRSKKKHVICEGASVVTYLVDELSLRIAIDLLLELLDEIDHRRHVHGTKVITERMILHVFRSKQAKCIAWGQRLYSLGNVESVVKDLLNLHVISALAKLAILFGCLFTTDGQRLASFNCF